VKYIHPNNPILMLYRLYSSSGNTLGVENYLGYFEIEANGHFSRYVEIRADGTAMRYNQSHDVDHFGQLPEGQWDEAEATKSEYGVVVPITAELFEAVWRKTRCDNDQFFTAE
jgi:hypothetical protein